jgi:hypothetical protein
MNAGGVISRNYVKAKGNDPGFALMSTGPAGTPLANYLFVGEGAIESLAVGGTVFTSGTNIDLATQAVSILGSNSVNIRGPTQISSLTVSSIAGAAYPPAPPVNATFSTIGLSTIGAIVAASAGNVQTFNTVIGNIRLQGGVVSTTSAGVAVSWTAFTTVPIILTGCTGTTGAGTTVVLQGGGESGVNISVNTGTTTEVYWLAIGAV